MQPIDKKTMETPPNKFYGVDVNNKDAVSAEFERLKKRHKIVTVLVIVSLLIISFFIYDFIRVTELGGKPLFVIEEKADGGTKFKGLGYEVLYCNTGERYVGPSVFKKCTDEGSLTIDNYIYKKFVDYAVAKEIIDKNNLDIIEFNLVEYDEKNDQGGGDYHVNIKYVCKNETKCVSLIKEYSNQESIDLYVRLNKYNEVYDIEYFKNSGVYYERLVDLYSTALKNYLVQNEKIDETNLRSFNLKLIENHGRYKFRDNVYDDSYLVQITYLCNDNGNTCIKSLDDTDIDGSFSNLMFYGAMFVNQDGQVALFGPKEYFDL